MTGFGAFLGAWGDGLAAGLPPRLRSLFRQAVTLVVPAGEGYLLHSARAGASLPRGTATGAELGRHLDALPGSLVLSVPEADRITQELSVPASARRSLIALLEGEIERLTPFKRNEVRIAYDILSEREGRLQIRLHVIPKQRLEQMLQRFRTDAGRPPDFVLAGQAQLETPSGFDFSGAPILARRGNGALWLGLLTVLLVAAVLSPAPKPFLALEDVTRESEALRPQVAELQAARANLEERHDLALRLQSLLGAAPDAVGLLEAVTEVVPDDAWLTALVMRGSTLTLEGFARDASGLLEEIAAMGGVASAQFEAPVTRDAGRDRFRIVARLEAPQ